MIQLNPIHHFLGAQKRLDSRYQILLALRSTIQVSLFQSYGELERTQLNSINSRDSFLKIGTANTMYILSAHLPQI